MNEITQKFILKTTRPILIGLKKIIYPKKGNLVIFTLTYRTFHKFLVHFQYPLEYYAYTFQYQSTVTLFILENITRI